MGFLAGATKTSNRNVFKIHEDCDLRDTQTMSSAKGNIKKVGFNMSKLNPRPILLLILDGWGYRKEKGHNAIAMANTPHWDYLLQTYPHTLLDASGLAVGLPAGQMGNSEVGHLTMGAGRVIYQDLSRINKDIETGEFFNNPCLLTGFKKIKASQKSVHILGLLSPGGIHSHEQHWYALLELAAQQGIQQCYLHPFLDGRDTPPKSAANYLENLEKKCKHWVLAKLSALSVVIMQWIETTVGSVRN